MKIKQDIIVIITTILLISFSIVYFVIFAQVEFFQNQASLFREDFNKKVFFYVSEKECNRRTNKDCKLLTCRDSDLENKNIYSCSNYLIDSWVPSSGDHLLNGYQLLDIALDVNSRDFNIRFEIDKNGFVEKFLQDFEEEKFSRETGYFNDVQMTELQKIINDIEFGNMENKYRKENDPEGGSTYTITVRKLPSCSSVSVKPITEMVICYENNCEEGFLGLKDKIMEFRGKLE
jgi:hypothetical protein